MNLPNFFIAGMPRCGTTIARRMLNKHPEVYIAHGDALRKHCGRHNAEIWYFNKDENYKKGLDWYLQCFKGENGEKYIGDKTPWYAKAPAPERIRNDLGSDVKFLMLFRDPVARVWSHWVHAKDRAYGVRYEGHNFGRCIRHRELRHSFSLVDGSRYALYLRSLLEFHDRDNIYIMINEEVKANPYEEYSKMFDWMGLRRLTLKESGNLRAKVNLSNYDKHGNIPEADEVFLKETEEFYNLIGREIESWK